MKLYHLFISTILVFCGFSSSVAMAALPTEVKSPSYTQSYVRDNVLQWTGTFWRENLSDGKDTYSCVLRL